MKGSGRSGRQRKVPGQLLCVSSGVVFLYFIFINGGRMFRNRLNLMDQIPHGDYRRSKAFGSRESPMYGKDTNTHGGTFHEKSKPNARIAILHIGPHKTASSYVQQRLCEERHLLFKHGYHVPLGNAAVLSEKITHEQQQLSATCPHQCMPKYFASVAFQLQGRDDEIISRFSCGSTDPLSDLQQELHRYSHTSIVLSSEEFDALDDQGVNKLADIFKGFDTRIVLFHRRKIGHIIGYYTKLSKRGNGQITFKDFLWEVIKYYEDGCPSGSNGSLGILPGTCYSRLIKRYMKYFGTDKVVIASYEGSIKAGDLWEIFVRDILLQSRRPQTDYSQSNSGLQQYPFEAREPVNRFELDPFLLSVAAFYRRNVDIFLGNLSTRTSSQLVDFDCLVKHLEPLRRALPQSCSPLNAFVKPWESSEADFFSSLEGVSLLHFTKKAGMVHFSPNKAKICTIDDRNLGRHDIQQSLKASFQHIHASIEKACSERATMNY